MATCRINEIDSWINCDMEAWDLDPEGLCIIHSMIKDKDNEGKFSVALQRKLDRHDYNFRKAFFPISFDLNFNKCIFDGPSDFSYSTFDGGAHFSGACFNGKVFFNGATIYRISNFSSAKFIDGGDFTHATFMGVIIMTWAEFGGPIYFRKLNSEIINKEREDIYFDFRYLNFLEKGMLHFQDVSLSQASFTDSDLRRVEFRNVSWHYYHGRQIIHDEITFKPQGEYYFQKVLEGYTLEVGTQIGQYLAEETLLEYPQWKNNYGDIERLYRNLKVNYEAEGDYKNAGDFHYGEMEMHRKANFCRRRIPISWFNLYWALSGYGERPSRAFGWLAGFLIGMATLVWGLGLEVGNPHYSHIADFGESFIYVLQKVTLQRPTWAVPQGFWGNLVSGLSVLLIPGQAALFLLALRNRLGRRR